MIRIKRIRTLVLCAWLTSLIFSAVSHAHLMTPNKGTLNFDETGGYLVLSLPTLALMKFDNNKDKILSIQEIKSQQKKMIKYITESLYLKSENQTTFLSGTMLAPQHSHDVNINKIDQVVVIGKFIRPFNYDISLQAVLLKNLASNEKVTITMTKQGNHTKQIFTFNNTNTSHIFE